MWQHIPSGPNDAVMQAFSYKQGKIDNPFWSLTRIYMTAQFPGSVQKLPLKETG
jgi:hypothetical protein